MTIACICNIAGDLLLVGKFGMGSAGAAIATVAAQGISVVCSFLIIKVRGFGFDYDTKELATVFAIIITVIYLGSLSKRRQNTVDIG